MRPSHLGCLALLGALLVGCSDSQEPQAAPSAPAGVTAAPAPSPTKCPAKPTDFAWPAQVPKDLPEPPGATLTEVQKRNDGLFVVQFTTAISLREAVLFLIEEMPKAGYTLARGDAENTEADAPFVKGNLRGVMRMLAIENCRTDWLMAITTGAPGVAPGGGNPILPPRASASPLPFG